MLTGLHGKLILSLVMSSVWTFLLYCQQYNLNKGALVWRWEKPIWVLNWCTLWNCCLCSWGKEDTHLCPLKKKDCVWKIFAVHETHISRRVLRDFCWSASLSSTFAFCIINSRRANEVKETWRWHCLDLYDHGNHSLILCFLLC